MAVEHAFDVSDNLPRVVVGDLRAPTGADALCSVHQHHWNDGNVPLGFDALVVVSHILEHRVVVDIEQVARQRTAEQCQQVKIQSPFYSSCKPNAVVTVFQSISTSHFLIITVNRANNRNRKNHE